MGKKQKSGSIGEAMSFVTSIGINFVVCIGLCLYLGKLADNYWQIRPIGTIIGILLGFITAVYSTYKKLRDFNDSQ